LRSPWSVVLHAIVFLAAVFHSVTWFNLTPRIMPARIGEDRLPDAWVSIGGGYLPWLIVTVVIAWSLLR
jgi:fumarate reductase subunit C